MCLNLLNLLAEHVRKDEWTEAKQTVLDGCVVADGWPNQWGYHLFKVHADQIAQVRWNPKNNKWICNLHAGSEQVCAHVLALWLAKASDTILAVAPRDLSDEQTWAVNATVLSVENKEISRSHSKPVENKPFLTLAAMLNVKTAQRMPLPISVYGNGPWTATDIKKAITISVSDSDIDNFFEYGEDSGQVVVGRQLTLTEYERLFKHIATRSGKTMRVYSQEMFVFHALTGIDPFGAPQTALAFAPGHPCICELLKQWFDWPSTHVNIGKLAIDSLGWQKVGLLKFHGYSTNRSTDERTRILEEIFTLSDLPMVMNKEYLQEWGEAKSSARLKKLANCLATFARNEKRKARSSLNAIEIWEKDLKWLEINYYRKLGFSFDWPNTAVK